jgi:hypothetical protein
MPTSSDSNHSHRALAILAALAISTGAVACGGGDDDGGGSGGAATAGEQEPLSEEAYLKQVNAAQTDFAADAAKLDLANPTSAKDFGRSLGSLEGLIDTLRTRLAEMAPPDEVGEQQDELVEQLRAYGDVIEREKGALTSGDPQKAKAAAQKVGKASTTFSQEFDATIEQVNANLGLETGSSR